jgi:glycolate oxidase
MVIPYAIFAYPPYPGQKALVSIPGRLSGEHGIGTAKARFLEKEFGKGTILYSKRIKAAVGPNNILNPGKIIGA